MTFNALVHMRIAVNEVGALAQGGPYAGYEFSLIEQLLAGTGALQIDQCYIGERTVASATADSLDVAAGGLLDMFGNVLTMAKIKGIILLNRPRDITVDPLNTTDLTLFGGSNPFVGVLGGTTPTIGPIKPGGVAMLYAGNVAGIGAVTASTADIVRVLNGSGAQAKYQIAILGTSA